MTAPPRPPATPTRAAGGPAALGRLVGRPALVVRWGAVAAVVALAVALAAAGGAPLTAGGRTAQEVGLQWALPLVTLVRDLAAALTVGGLVAALGLFPVGAGGRLRRPGLDTLADVAIGAAVWAIASFVATILTAAVILDVVPWQLPGRIDVAASVPQVRGLALATLLAILTTAFCLAPRTTTGVAAALVVGIAAVLPDLTTGHAADGAHPVLGVGGLLVHVVAASVWLGGLLAVCRQRRGDPIDRAIGVERFSRLALGAAVVVGASGALTALLHLDVEAGGSPAGVGGDVTAALRALVGTGYGALVVAKIVCFAGLVAAGWWHRRRSLPALRAGEPAAFVRLAAVELAVLALAVAFGVALSRTP